jgi:hypothetical protein
MENMLLETRQLHYFLALVAAEQADRALLAHELCLRAFLNHIEFDRTNFVEFDLLGKIQ